ncbi:CGNR zinc finger domain-containing protein [Nonomuraea ferruginea]
MIRVAVGLVNSLTPGERRGRSPRRPPVWPRPRPRACVRAIRATSRSPRPRGRSWPRSRSGCARCSRPWRLGDVDAAAERINALLAETGARPMLMRHDGEPWHLHYHGPGGTLAGDWAASCATGLAHVLGSEFHDRLGVCTAPHCDRVYVDVSRNGTRRFCSTACQNRVKTAAFRARSKTP